MSVPDFQSLMLPVLKVCGREKTIASRAVIENVIVELNLTPEQIAELLPSKTQRTIDNRVYWCLVYMQKGGLIDRVERGKYQITDEGRKTLANNVERVDIKYLRQFEKFREFQKKSSSGESSQNESTDDTNADPIALVEKGYLESRASVTTQILDALRKVHPTSFELIVIELLERMGYGVPGLRSAVHSGGSGDGGIDGEISQDILGLDKIYVQAKRYQDGSKIGRQTLQQFVGSLTERRSKKGVFLTTSAFASTVEDYVDKVDFNIVLIDGERLANLMFDHGLGVVSQVTYEIKKLDLDYFEEEI